MGIVRRLLDFLMKTTGINDYLYASQMEQEYEQNVVMHAAQKAVDKEKEDMRDFARGDKVYHIKLGLSGVVTGVLMGTGFIMVKLDFTNESVLFDDTKISHIPDTIVKKNKYTVVM